MKKQGQIARPTSCYRAPRCPWPELKLPAGLDAQQSRATLSRLSDGQRTFWGCGTASWAVGDALTCRRPAISRWPLLREFSGGNGNYAATNGAAPHLALCSQAWWTGPAAAGRLGRTRPLRLSLSLCAAQRCELRLHAPDHGGALSLPLTAKRLQIVLSQVASKTLRDTQFLDLLVS
ncbi:hypothetical protein AOQ84DRAFT_227255 [Glonium stellatum]|uniref:Uncharacterized protein n=1 Tax=Glonium stellatum TaxID=574774 RepID=A0A8E2JN57_9PEZI|nr:hypothetical protein AOQ84DRAFT_227255 [Glonium stellatum]